MKVSGKKVAEVILKKLASEIKKENLKPSLAIILAGSDPSSRIYVNNKIKAAEKIGITAKLYEFSDDQLEDCLKLLKKLNNDTKISGIIIQHPVYGSWNYDELLGNLNPKKDVDGFRSDSLFSGATALGVWEMLTAFALLEGFKKTDDFLKDKKIVLVGKGKAAGGPTYKFLTEKGFEVEVVEKETENPRSIIKKADVVISATGVKNIINKTNLKRGAFVVGIGIGKEIIDGKEKIYGDINEEEVSQIAKLYNPNLGGIGPLTIASLLKNVVSAAKVTSNK